MLHRQVKQGKAGKLTAVGGGAFGDMVVTEDPSKKWHLRKDQTEVNEQAALKSERKKTFLPGRATNRCKGPGPWWFDEHQENLYGWVKIYDELTAQVKEKPWLSDTAPV